METLRAASKNGNVVLFAPDRITLGASANAVRETLKALTKGGFPNVTLDMSKMSYVDSAGLGTLVASFHMLRSAGGNLTLNRLGAKFAEVLDVTKLSNIFNIKAEDFDDLPQVEIAGNDTSLIKAARALPLVLSLRENRVRVELGMHDGVYRVSIGDGSVKSDVIVAAPYLIAEANRTILSDNVRDFEDLINSTRTTEDDIHQFLKEYPNFLLAHDYKELHSKVLLERPSDGPLIPDFMLQPFDTELCDLLELKLPQEPVLVGTRNRRRFSSAVYQAVAQLRTYRDYFEDKAHRDALLRRSRIKAYRPRMTVLIGRMANVDPIEYRQIADGEKEVDVMTYDDLLARAKRFLVI